MTLYFDGNFASGNFNAYSGGAVVSPQDITIVNDPVLGAARKVVKMSVNDGDNGGVTGDNRAQLETPQLWGNNTDLWIGFGIMWPSSWPDLGNGNPFRWATFAQVYGPPWNGSAWYSFDMNVGTILGFGGWDATSNVQRNVWYDFVVHEYLTSSTANSISEFWMNSGSGWQYVNAFNGRATFGSPNNGGPNYHKIACYTGASQWSSSAYPLVVYFNQHKVGSSRADVEPNSYAGTAPGAPTAVTASAGAAQATVSWTAPSAGSSAIIDYTVTSSPGNIVRTVSTSPATVTGLTNGTSYTFTVKARNSVGTGPASVQSNAVTPVAAATAPGPPTGLVAVAGNAQASVVWVAPANNGGAALTTYTVTSSPGGIAVTTGLTSATVTGLTNGLAYTFTAVARNVVGASVSSAPSVAVVPTVPVVPPTTNTGTVVGLTNGVAYTFTVKARNSAGSGPASVPSNSVTPVGTSTVPGPPTAVVAAPGNTSITVGWTAPANNGGLAILDYTVLVTPGGAG